MSTTMQSLYFVFPIFFVLCILSSASFQNDQQSLLAFKDLITTDPFNSTADWTPALPFCNWTGVSCSRRHPLRVVALNLSATSLGGSISPSLGNLSFLRTLDLSGNALHAHIPTQLGHLFRLRELWLHDNQLDGNIPSQLSSCRKLTLLALSFNNLNGNIPQQLGFLSHLQQLYLNDNQLDGNIPSQLSSCRKLTLLVLLNNNLNGNIPQQLGFLSHLQQLFLSNNNLTGTIPPSLGNLSALVDLDISANWMVGTIPPQLASLTRLNILNLRQNALSGAIPSFLSNLSSLTTLSMGQNMFNGNIPQELGLLRNLQGLGLFSNELSGTIPISLSNLFNLRDLYLWGNQLSGNIPNFIGNYSKLVDLELSYNMLNGIVPIELGKLSLLQHLDLQNNQLTSVNATTMPFIVALTNCSHLQLLNLNNNALSAVLPLTIGRLSINLSILALSKNKIRGNIPSHIGNLTSLTYLKLSENLLNGSIPPLGNLKKIERLNLGNNRLEGNIPNDFEQLQHLGLLNISNNMLSGKIPNSLAALKQLRRLHLNHNQFSGSIPANLGNCINLELLDLSHNMLSGTIPQEIVELYNLQFYLNLSGNLLEGSLTMGIGKIAMAQAIDISANQLTGVIPSTLGSCSELQSLNLSRNFFQGSIPDSFENLQSLVNLDLSSNSLSGTIPITLKKLKMLQFLNLSSNNLTGEIPEGGFFANQTIVMSLIGNPSLCGPQEFGLSACPTPRDHFAFVKKKILPVSGVIAFILFCLLSVFLWRRNMCVENFNFSHSIFQMLEHRRISYQELHTATNGFADANLLGTGNFGLVYKGLLSDGTLVAVKVLQLQNDQAEKSFKAECGVLQKVQHRNLVKIITSCSNLHFKSLVFKFMSNGSLEKHLHPDGEDVCGLTLNTRLDIAIDVAHAIKYLHHDSFVQVVHCDIKPNNVLLDEDMLGHVTDFGIARLIGATSTDSLTSTLALKGSVGYIAPEYGLGETISSKGDVYSYGILLLEMLTRKRPTSDMFVGDLSLHKWVSLAFPSKVRDVADGGLFSEVDGDEFVENSVYKCIQSLLRVGLLCSKDSPNERPTMRDVVLVLENLREDLVANENPSRRLRRSISNLLHDTNETRNDASTSNYQSYSTS